MIFKIILLFCFCEFIHCETQKAFENPNGSEDKKFWTDSAINDLKSRLNVKSNTNIAKNVIVFIGDGMGVQTHTASRIYKGQKKSKSGEEQILEWEKFPYTGQSKTYNVNYQVPDSAGTATALFSGVKTSMSVLGIDKTPPWNKCDKDLVEKHKLDSLLHKAVANGKATGIVTTTRITHATPAALYSHTPNRDWEADTWFENECKDVKDIAKQLIENDVGQKLDLIFGGGRRNFLTKNQGGKRTDEDLIEVWKKKKGENGAVLQNITQLKDWNEEGFALGLFSMSHMDFTLDRQNPNECTAPCDQPPLDLMVKKAINRLKKNDKGFFLMVEGGRIDQAHHKNWAKKAFEETLELEKAVKIALEMTDEKDTLMMVTADHSHSITMNGYPKRGENILGYVAVEEEKSSASTEIFSQYPKGKGTKMPWSIISYANGRGFDHHYLNDSARALDSAYPWKDLRKEIWTDDQYTSPAMLPVADDYETHGGEDVPVLANGPWAHLFTGVHEQSYFYHAITHAAGWDKKVDEMKFGSSNAKVSVSTSVLLVLTCAMISSLIL